MGVEGGRAVGPGEAGHGAGGREIVAGETGEDEIPAGVVEAERAVRPEGQSTMGDAGRGRVGEDPGGEAGGDALPIVEEVERSDPCARELEGRGGAPGLEADEEDT